MKLRLSGLGIFLILLGALALCPLLRGWTVEGMSTTRKPASKGGKRRNKAPILNQTQNTPPILNQTQNTPPILNQTQSTDPTLVEVEHTMTPYSQTQDVDTDADTETETDDDTETDTDSDTDTDDSYPRPQAPPGAYPPAYGQGPPQAQVTPNGYDGAPGDEDMYILKSEIVPPVCPACPTQTTCPRQEPCPPCPPCARCPEPAFECKKVPNYRTDNSQYLPRPVLSDFSQFGM